MSVTPAVIGSAPHSGATKHDVINELGEPVLLLPSLINRGLEANDRAKYVLTLLQAARADEPEEPSRRCATSASQRGSPVRNTISKDIIRVGRELADALGHEPLFHLEGPLDTELPAALRPHILAVVREALTNVAHHAKPTQAVVTVELKGNRLDVIIEDHGKGPVDKQPGGRGLLNMAERARSLSGEMQLSPKPSGGSRPVEAFLSQPDARLSGTAAGLSRPAAPRRPTAWPPMCQSGVDVKRCADEHFGGNCTGWSRACVLACTKVRAGSTGVDGCGRVGADRLDGSLAAAPAGVATELGTERWPGRTGSVDAAG